MLQDTRNKHDASIDEPDENDFQVIVGSTVQALVFNSARNLRLGNTTVAFYKMLL